MRARLLFPQSTWVRKDLKALPAGNPVRGRVQERQNHRQWAYPPEILLPVPSIQNRRMSLQPQELEQWEENRGCTKYKTIPNDYRLSIDRSCLCFREDIRLAAVQSASVTILASNPQVRNGCGCVTAQARQTSIRWPTSPLWLRWPPFCTALTLPRIQIIPAEFLKRLPHTAFFARFSSGPGFYALFLLVG